VARPAPPPAQPAVVPGTEAVASLDDLTDEPLLDAAPGPAAPLPAPAVPVPAPTPPPEQPASAVPPPQQPAAEVPAAPAEIPPALTQPAPLRKFREMPPEYRADFPALKIEVHVHEAAVQRRFVMVNGRRYREGERLAEGPQLVEIVAEGMVLEYRGEKVLYTLGR
jgi:general secretion pathway protein B